MRGVTVCALRGHRETALQQPLSMDTLGISLHDFVLGALVPHSRLASLPVTSRTKVRNMRRKRKGEGISLPEDLVCSVALHTCRCIRVALRQQ